jgi:hypothetical protein
LTYIQSVAREESKNVANVVSSALQIGGLSALQEYSNLIQGSAQKSMLTRLFNVKLNDLSVEIYDTQIVRMFDVEGDDVLRFLNSIFKGAFDARYNRGVPPSGPEPPELQQLWRGIRSQRFLNHLAIWARCLDLTVVALVVFGTTIAWRKNRRVNAVLNDAAENAEKNIK